MSEKAPPAKPQSDREKREGAANACDFWMNCADYIVCAIRNRNREAIKTFRSHDFMDTWVKSNAILMTMLAEYGLEATALERFRLEVDELLTALAKRQKPDLQCLNSCLKDAKASLFQNKCRLAAMDRGDLYSVLQRQNIELNPAELKIIRTLGDQTLTGEKLAPRTGYEYSAHFKALLANLCRRKILGNRHPGYFVRLEYRMLLYMPKSGLSRD